MHHRSQLANLSPVFRKPLNSVGDEYFEIIKSLKTEVFPKSIYKYDRNMKHGILNVVTSI